MRITILHKVHETGNIVARVKPTPSRILRLNIDSFRVIGDCTRYALSDLITEISRILRPNIDNFIFIGDCTKLTLSDFTTVSFEHHALVYPELKFARVKRKLT